MPVQLPHHRWKILAGKPSQVEKMLNDIYDAGHPDIWVNDWKPIGNSGQLIAFVRVGITKIIHQQRCEAYNSTKTNPESNKPVPDQKTTENE